MFRINFINNSHLFSERRDDRFGRLPNGKSAIKSRLKGRFIKKIKKGKIRIYE
jgi:hypothetical protein